MDFAADFAVRSERGAIRILVPPHDDTSLRFFSYVTRAKALAADVTHATVKALELHDRRISMRGFWPALVYLLERYPEPELLPGDCVKRSLLRSLTAELLGAGAPTGSFDRMGQSPGFIMGSPTILDIAYLSVTDKSDERWAHLHELFEVWVTSLEEADAEHHSDVRAA